MICPMQKNKNQLICLMRILIGTQVLMIVYLNYITTIEKTRLIEYFKRIC